MDGRDSRTVGRGRIFKAGERVDQGQSSTARLIDSGAVLYGTPMGSVKTAP